MIYTQASIDRVKDADLVTVIQRYVDLKPSGSTLKGNSPFKEERTPSFMVSKAKNIWKCFATGKGGNNPISFVMELENLGFKDAVKTVAEICNIQLEEEELTEEQAIARTHKQKLKNLNEQVAKQYAQEFTKLPENHWAKQHIASLGYTQDEIIMFQIGYAPGNLVSKAVVKHAQLDLAQTVGLVTTKQGASYDFFFDRIMFPIHNRNGEVVGFGGRCSREKQQETAKYINSKESDVFYKKEELYGLSQARKNIVKLNEAILVEGYTDVISMHQAGANNTVATCGTALTESHAKKVSYLADKIIVFRDGDTSGLKALLRDIDILLHQGKEVAVVIAEEGEDPDSIARNHDIDGYINQHLEDAVLWKAQYFLNEAGDNANQKAQALIKTIETLACIESHITRKEYYKTVGKLYGHSARDIAKEVKAFLDKKKQEALAKAAREGNSDEFLKLPKGADIEEYKEKGFVTTGNTFWVRSREGWMKASNFKLSPLFHVEGDKDTSRLFDIVNEKGEKALVELESSLLLNMTQNQNRLLDYGVFMWDPELSANHFKLIMTQLIKRFIKVKPFSYFGWQTKGFWAYSNGVFYDNQFQEVNEYGIVELKGLETIDSDYYNNTPYFYSPAFNVTNKHKEDDLDQYQNDRSFIYKKSPVNFNTWSKQMHKVYGSKANIAIGFAVATMFKDFIMNRYSFFPLLFCSGEKGSGKTAFSESIGNLFTFKQKAFQIDSGSKVGFFRRLQRGKNTATVMEEFHDKIDSEKFQALKGAWDGRGREIGMMTSDSRTKVSDVRCSIIIVGQYLSTRDDNSLTSRSIIQHFIKPQENYENDQIEAFNTLMEWEDAGLTSMVLEVVKHREQFEREFHEAYNKNSKLFKKHLAGFEYQERMLQNYNAIYTPLSILFQHFELPFTKDEFFAQCTNGIIDNSDLLVESEGLSEFWNTIAKLAEGDHIAKIKESHHYLIDTPHEQKVATKKGEAGLMWKNTERCRVLYLRLSSVHQDYVDAVSRRDGVDVIGEATLKNYFKSKRYFIGSVKGKRFNNDLVTSAYAFNYDMMVDNNILQLPKHISKKDENVPLLVDNDNPLIPEPGDVSTEKIPTGLFNQDD